MGIEKISKCINNHFFITDVCPYCREKKYKEVDYMSGDCIYCGALCFEGAYACNNPRPINSEDSDNIDQI